MLHSTYQSQRPIDASATAVETFDSYGFRSQHVAEMTAMLARRSPQPQEPLP